MKKTLLSIICMLVAIACYADITAKAVVSTDGKTLTFYYDDADHSSEGTSFALNEGENEPGWADLNKTITTAVFDESFKEARPTSTYCWFGFIKHNEEGESIGSPLTEIKGFENLNTSEVTNMAMMFYSCSNLKAIDLSHFNTGKAMNMASMFYNCSSIRGIDLSNFNTENVTNMEAMFYNCTNLKTVWLSSFNTEKVMNMSSMFANCTKLKHIYSNSFSTASLTNSIWMFTNCTSLVGENGTTYNESASDATYAKMDGGESNPGYFSTVQNCSDYLYIYDGYGSGVFDVPLDFSTAGFKAYIVTGYNETKNEASLMRIMEAPEYTPFIALGPEGEYELKRGAECNMLYKNYLTYSIIVETISSLESINHYYDYYFLEEGEDGLAFYQPEDWYELSANTPYLAIYKGETNNAKSIKLVFEDQDETTAISSINAHTPDAKDAYNLAGQKVDDSYKGIVIINGKKVMKR